MGSQGAIGLNPYKPLIDGDFWSSEEEWDIINSFKFINNSTEYVCNMTFHDVFARNWYCDAVRYAYMRNIIAGYNKYNFAPLDNLTREQLVTFLWRIEGEPNYSTYDRPFSDIGFGFWYTDAVIWAKENGIVNGYEGTTLFGRGDKIIRQDLAKILYNYAKYKGKDLSIGSYASFTDASSVSTYAINAIGWAVKHGVISGNALPDGTKTIAPHDNATRAEAAVMIYKFCENVLK